MHLSLFRLSHLALDLYVVLVLFPFLGSTPDSIRVYMVATRNASVMNHREHRMLLAAQAKNFQTFVPNSQVSELLGIQVSRRYLRVTAISSGATTFVCNI